MYIYFTMMYLRNDEQLYFSLRYLNRAHTWIGIWLMREAVTRNFKYITLYLSSSTVITSNDERRYIACMERNLDRVEWIYETPFGAHVNDANWCLIFLSLLIEENADDPLKEPNRIFPLMSATKFSMHGSPRYSHTLISVQRSVII